MYAYTVAEGAVPGFLPKGVSADADSSDNYSYTLTNAPTVVSFSKQSLTGGAELPGAHLTLTDLTPDAGQGDHHVELGQRRCPACDCRLADRRHTYSMTETIAPNGYAVAETITFTVGADGTITATDASGQPASNGSGEVSNRHQHRHHEGRAINITFSKRATGAGTAELAGATLTISHVEGVTPSWMIRGSAATQTIRTVPATPPRMW